MLRVAHEMNEEPLVSVIIPTYQRSALMRRAIESVRRQTHRNLEILVIDDASADNTEDVVRGIIDVRIQYIRHPKNKGVSAARNTGIRAAGGDYVAFLDDDDEWREDKLEKQLAAMEAYDAVLAGSLVNRKYRKSYGKSEVTAKDLRKGNQFPPSTLLVKCSVIRDVWFDEDLRQGEDWDAYIRILQKYKIGYINAPLLFLNDGSHQRATNAGRNLRIAELEKRMAVIIKHREFFGSYWFRRHVASVLLSHLRDRNGATKQLQYAIRRCGLVPVAAVITSKLRRAATRIIQDMRRPLYL